MSAIQGRQDLLLTCGILIYQHLELHQPTTNQCLSSVLFS